MLLDLQGDAGAGGDDGIGGDDAAVLLEGFGDQALLRVGQRPSGYELPWHGRDPVGAGDLWGWHGGGLAGPGASRCEQPPRSGPHRGGDRLWGPPRPRRTRKLTWQPVGERIQVRLVWLCRMRMWLPVAGSEQLMDRFTSVRGELQEHETPSSLSPSLRRVRSLQETPTPSPGSPSCAPLPGGGHARYLCSGCSWMMWAVLELWALPLAQLLIPWENTSASRCGAALKCSWGTQSGGLRASGGGHRQSWGHRNQTALGGHREGAQGNHHSVDPACAGSRESPAAPSSPPWCHPVCPPFPPPPVPDAPSPRRRWMVRGSHSSL